MVPRLLHIGSNNAAQTFASSGKNREISTRARVYNGPGYGGAA
jgi:hypothetical protein